MHETCPTCAESERYWESLTTDGKGAPVKPPRGVKTFMISNEQYQAQVAAAEAKQAASDARWAALETAQNGDGS